MENKQRQKAYQRLIQTLLNAEIGREREILAANQYLVNEGLNKAILSIASSFIQQYKLIEANRLMNIVGYLLGIYIDTSPNSFNQKYQIFLENLLNIIQINWNNIQAIYPILEANVNNLNHEFIVFLEHYSLVNLRSLESEKAKVYASAITILSRGICEFPFGNKCINVEIAIAGYGIAINIFTKENCLVGWANINNDLGIAYLYRIKENKSVNIEYAIKCFKRVLQVRTYDTFPQEWADTLNNLGFAYTDRIEGDKAENIEQAIQYFNEALQVINYDISPQVWAKTKINLGKAYSSRIIGDKADSMEFAINNFDEALKVLKNEVSFLDWANVQNNLGNAYCDRIKGNTKNNIEYAIIAYNNALEVFGLHNFIQDWARVKNNLGIAYYYYHKLVEGSPENLEFAISAYHEALEVRIKQVYPQQWATTQNNLGLAYCDRIGADRAENIQRAIECFNDALKVRTREAYPQDWAATKNNLGKAYYLRINTDKTQNIQKAIECFQEALAVRTKETFPKDYAETLFNLGIAYQDAQDFKLAYNTFYSAIQTVELLRNEIISGEETKHKQAEDWNELFRRMVEVCLELNNLKEAIEYVERSKNRSLVELIFDRDLKTIFPTTVVSQIENIRDEIAKIQYQIQNGIVENPIAMSQYVQKLRQERNQLQEQYFRIGSNFKIDSFLRNLDEHTAIIEWFFTNDKIICFIVSREQKITLWQSQLEAPDTLLSWINTYLKDYYQQKSQWKEKLEENLKSLAEILCIEKIINQIDNKYNKLIIIPYRFLHLLPLHALPIGDSCLLDLFPKGVAYAPSCQVMQQVQLRQRTNIQSLFAIQNPTEDLNYADLEVQVIQSYFNTFNVLKKTSATLTAINDLDLNSYDCVHFSCHGYFNLTNPKKSALILANRSVDGTHQRQNTEHYLNLRLGETHDLEKCLTLDKIFTLKLRNCRLATLSACETGLIDFNNISDEYVGLPSGFLLAGSSSVVSSLWKVDDLCTSFLMIKFYENLFKLDHLKTGDVAIALNQAQTWLRNLTIEELDKFLEKYKPEIEKVLAQLRVGQRITFQESLKLIKQRQPLPFANPYYWAGFTASGS